MKKYTISDGAGTQAVILPEKGATVISLTRGGEEFLCGAYAGYAAPSAGSRRTDSFRISVPLPGDIELPGGGGDASDPSAL